jgi:hypothetical protein
MILHSSYFISVTLAKRNEKYLQLELTVVACTSNPSKHCNLITGVAEAKASKVPGWFGLQSEYKASLCYIVASTNY